MRKQLAVAVCALMMSAGCSRYARLTTGGAMTATGLLTLYYSSPSVHSCDEDDVFCDEDEWGLGVYFAVPLLIAGAALLFSGIVSESALAPDMYRPPQAHGGVGAMPQQLHQSSSEEARQLALQIQLAARAGNCQEVMMKLQQLSAQNLPLARWTSSSDPYVRLCVTEAAVQPAAPPPAAPPPAKP